MEKEVERKIIAILKILSEEREPLGASLLARRLKDYGIDLTDRAVRYHLKIMDTRGLTQGHDRAGRTITDQGREELSNALVSDKVGLVITKIDTLSYQTHLDTTARTGRVILNLSFISKKDFPRSLEVMESVFKAKLCLSDLVIVAREGEKIGGVQIPAGAVGFGSVCSVTLNGIFMKAGIPVHSRFGGTLQMIDSRPVRFTDLITYAGTSLDPLEVFIRSKMTSVRQVAKKGTGKLLASFREVPAISLPDVEGLLKQLLDVGIFGVLMVGRPGQPLLEMQVGLDCAGLVVVGGLNPLAALEEAGIGTDNRAMATLIEFERLVPFSKL